MKTSTCIFEAVAAGLAAFALSTAAAPSQRPNFVVIYGEGAGWTSSSVQMDDRNPASKGTALKTPNLERLAAAGMRFANGYAASPRCTPSRAALFTGCSPAALHMTFVGDGKRDEAVLARVIAPHAVLELPASTTTVGELLQRAGYATAHFGKWHVGRESPAKHGFDENDGANGNGGPENVASPNPKQALAITAKGVEFMTRQAKAGRPFYLQMSHYPNQEEKGAGGGGKNRAPDANATEMMGITDRTLGQVVDAIEQLGLKGSTYVFYTTDHGTPGRNAPLTGGKGTVSEGGLRVPFLVAGPGVAAGACSHVRVSGTDWLPTVAELAGVNEPLPKEVEGGSLASVLKGAGQGVVLRPREEFVVHFPHYDKDAIGPATALYLGDWKLVRIYASGERRLFDLSQDLVERDDLAKSQPQKAAELDQRLTDYLKAVNAQMPNVNASVPASQRPAEKKGGKGKGKQ